MPSVSSAALGQSKDELNVLILYACQSTYTSTVAEHLGSFRRFSRHTYFYADAVNGSPCDLDLEVFDAVVLHYSTAIYHEGYLSPNFVTALKGYTGLKVLFIQDEYESTETLRQNMAELGVQVMFTCVPQKYIDSVYPRARFPGVEFVQNLTGYVPAHLESMASRKPIAGRQWSIGYRGRPLHYRFGHLGQEKIAIGRRMRDICKARGISTNIDWTEEGRIYWDDWYRFLADCKVTLGTESGSNIFDDTGAIRDQVDRFVASRPEASYEEIFEACLKPHEAAVAVMNQVSPRVFEAVALGTALVLFEGEYSGVVRPWEHYIPLRKDFANIEEVLAAIGNDELLQDMADRAYRDVIESGKYSYRAFIGMFDQVVDRHVRSPRRYRIFSTVVAAQPADTRWSLGQVTDAVSDAELRRHIHGALRIFRPDETLTNTATNVPMFHMDRRAIYFAMTTPAQRIARQLRLGTFGRMAVRLALPVWHAVPRDLQVRVRNLVFRLAGRKA